MAVVVLLAGAIFLLFVPACESDAVPPLRKPEPKPQLLKELPETCNTPHGLQLFPDGSGDIVVSCPNFSDPVYAPQLMKLHNGSNELTPFFTVPLHPDTGRSGPMGMDFGPDGHLYVADDQYRFDAGFKSRLLRVRIEGGQAVDFQVVVEGLKMAAAVKWSGDELFVTDPALDMADQPGTSGLYRFSRAELAESAPVQLQPPPRDPHLLATFRTQPNRGLDLAGAGGIAFDRGGHLYTGNRGDGVMSRITFDEQGNLAAQDLWVATPDMLSVEGLSADARGDKIYVADAAANAIRVISASTGAVTTVWANEDPAGAEQKRRGLLDQPGEVLARGDELIVANFDLPPASTGPRPYLNRARTAPATLSIIPTR